MYTHMVYACTIQNNVFYSQSVLFAMKIYLRIEQSENNTNYLNVTLEHCSFAGAESNKQLKMYHVKSFTYWSLLWYIYQYCLGMFIAKCSILFEIIEFMHQSNTKIPAKLETKHTT